MADEVVVGIDLSLTSSGIARIDVAGATTSRVTSTGRDGATLPQRHARLEKLRAAVVTAAIPADLVVIEGPSFGSRSGQGAQHDRAGLWWLVVSSLLAADLRVVEVSPSGRAKYATGKGNAAKDAVLLAVSRRYPDVAITGNDEADALVLAAMGARHLGMAIDEPLPLVHLQAMGKVSWPAPPAPEPVPR